MPKQTRPALRDGSVEPWAIGRVALSDRSSHSSHAKKTKAFALREPQDKAEKRPGERYFGVFCALGLHDILEFKQTVTGALEAGHKVFILFFSGAARLLSSRRRFS